MWDLPCPECRKVIAAEAAICPHCQYAFSDAEIEIRKRRVNTKTGIMVALILLPLAYCTLVPDSKEEPDPAQIVRQAEDRRLGQHCLNDWDGGNRSLIEQVKAVLRDPDSFEHAATRIGPLDGNGSHAIAMQYRARNGFGGMNVQQAIGMVNSSDCSATLISADISR